MLGNTVAQPDQMRVSRQISLKNDPQNFSDKSEERKPKLQMETTTYYIYLAIKTCLKQFAKNLCFGK